MFKNKYLYILILLLFSIVLSISWFGRLIDQKMSDYVTEEVNKVSKILIRKILNKDFFENIDVDELFTIDKNNNEEIEMINLNAVKVNDIIGKINDEILYYFNEFDKGNVKIIEEFSNVFNNFVENKEKGMFINVPIGIIFSNPILFSIGPQIPIKLLLTGQVESNINTSIKQYGINNVLLQISVEIKVTEKIIFPFSSRYVDVNLEVPLIIELISGKIPENYLNNQSSDIIK